MIYTYYQKRSLHKGHTPLKNKSKIQTLQDRDLGNERLTADGKAQDPWTAIMWPALWMWPWAKGKGRDLDSWSSHSNGRRNDRGRSRLRNPNSRAPKFSPSSLKAKRSIAGQIIGHFPDLKEHADNIKKAGRSTPSRISCSKTLCALAQREGVTYLGCARSW